MGVVAGVEVRLDQTRGSTWPQQGGGERWLDPPAAGHCPCLLLSDAALWGFLNHFCSL